VVDVAKGHIDALNWMNKRIADGPATGSAGAAGGAARGVYDTFNFGTGNGVTVFELVHAMEKAAGKTVPLVVGPRRPGDLTQSYCDPAKALRVLGWKAELSLDAMCEDAWRWQSKNPKGYDT
jgi:UDP-glucose 4-epimerase